MGFLIDEQLLTAAKIEDDIVMTLTELWSLPEVWLEGDLISDDMQ